MFETSILLLILTKVCYRESNQEQFESFVQEVEDDGQMTDAKKEIFKKLEESPKQPKSVTQVRGKLGTL